ncbi:MAG: diphosphomevalonate decarboxylase [Polyangia bacterium]|jgi:diphosphomevalonate decarboxylase
MSSSNLPLSVTARAGTNIALVKYWGKRDPTLNLPAAGSLSLTLANFGSETAVRFVAEGGDNITVDGAPAPPHFAERVRRFLDLVRREARIALPAEVSTRNSVPTAAGLASSASGFAALALAVSRAAGMNLALPELSALARRGSGSAARSIFGGFVEMAAGERRDGSDACATGLLPAAAWDVRLVVAITAEGPKAIGSTEAMDLTARTSPYYAGWLQAVPRDLAAARAAVLAQDLTGLGRVAERSAVRMHACAMAADPPILYWNGATLAAMETVRRLRAAGTEAFFTIDAGPHVKVLCAARDASLVEPALAATPGVLRTLVLTPGPGAQIVREERR